MRNHQDPIPFKQHLEIPVLCLRWTHSCINRKMMFGHDGVDDESIFKLVDQLQRGEKSPVETREPLDVAQHQGCFCSLSNRRLTALMMYQGLHRDRVVKAWCRICSNDTEKFEEANSTKNEGLGIETRDGDSQHFGAPLFQRGEAALQAHTPDQRDVKHGLEPTTSPFYTAISSAEVPSRYGLQRACVDALQRPRLQQCCCDQVAASTANQLARPGQRPSRCMPFNLSLTRQFSCMPRNRICIY